MSQLIVGLFASADQAAHVVQELSSIGVEAGQVVMLAGERAEQTAEPGAAADPGPSIDVILRNAGLSEAQAHAHAEAVRGGAVAVIVTPATVPGANIKAVMLSHGSIDIDASAPEPNTLGQAPHLEPGAASSGLGLQDPGAAGVPEGTAAPEDSYGARKQ
jgi:hypothetical protein